MKSCRSDMGRALRTNRGRLFSKCSVLIVSTSQSSRRAKKFAPRSPESGSSPRLTASIISDLSAPMKKNAMRRLPELENFFCIMRAALRFFDLLLYPRVGMPEPIGKRLLWSP